MWCNLGWEDRFLDRRRFLKLSLSIAGTVAGVMAAGRRGGQDERAWRRPRAAASIGSCRVVWSEGGQGLLRLDGSEEPGSEQILIANSSLLILSALICVNPRRKGSSHELREY